MSNISTSTTTSAASSSFATPLGEQLLPKLTEAQTRDLVAHKLREIFGVEAPEKTLKEITSAVHGGYKPLDYFFSDGLPEAPKASTHTKARVKPLGELPCVKEVTDKYPWAEPILYCYQQSYYLSVFKDSVEVCYYRTAKDRLLGKVETCTLACWCQRRRVDPDVLERQFFEYNYRAFMDALSGGEPVEDVVLDDPDDIFLAYTEYIPTTSETYPGLCGSCMSDPDLGEPKNNIHPVMAYGGDSPDPAKLWVLRISYCEGKAFDTMARAVVHNDGYVRLYLGGDNLLDSLFIKYEAKKRLKARGYTHDNQCLLGATLRRVELEGLSRHISTPYLDGDFKNVLEFPDYLRVVENGETFSLTLEEHTSGKIRSTLDRCTCCGNYETIVHMKRNSDSYSYYCSDCAKEHLYYCDYCEKYHSKEDNPPNTYDGELLCKYSLERQGLTSCARCGVIVHNALVTAVRDYKTLQYRLVCKDCVKTAVICRGCGDILVVGLGETRETLATLMFVDDGSRFGSTFCKTCLEKKTEIKTGEEQEPIVVAMENDGSVATEVLAIEE